MSTVSSLESPPAGIDRCWRRMERIADRLANVGNEKRGVGPAHEFVDMIQTRWGFSANLKVMATADQMTRSAIDIKA